MPIIKSREIRLASHPKGYPTATNFNLTQIELGGCRVIGSAGSAGKGSSGLGARKDRMARFLASFIAPYPQKMHGQAKAGHE
jgi:hypothetical protein